jgi:hypothetical protein
MSIAELIMTGTKRSSESTAWVGDSLAKIGQNVGAALAQKEQQKQAQEMLPFLQQSMQESMTLAGQGQTGEAYAKLMPFITNPAVINNPNLLLPIETALKLNQVAADDYLRNRQISAYQSRSSGKSGGGFEVPSFEEMDDSTSLVDANQPTTIDTTVGGSYDILDQENAENLPQNQPRRFNAGLRNEQTPFSFGMETGNASLYVADEDTKNKAVSAIQDYKAYTPDQKSEVVNSITDTSNQPPADNIRVDIPGFGQGFITGPSMARAQEVTGVKRTQKVSQKTGLEREEEKTYGQKEKTQDQLAFEGFAQNIGVASAMFKQNKQLRDIMEMAGGDITQITTDDDVVEDTNGKQVPVKRIFVKGQDAGMLSMERPIGADGKPDPRRMSEAQAVETIIDAPGLIERFGWKFYPQQGEKPAAAETPAPTQGGIPATQLAATSAVEIPAEAVELQKIVEQGQAAKAKETANSVEKRIKDIDAQIKRLASPTTIAYDQAGLIAVERPIRKTPEEAQADIEKIAQLKSEKELLFVKTEKAYNTAKSEGRVFQSAEEAKSSKKKFPAGTIIYIGREPAKVK